MICVSMYIFIFIDDVNVHAHNVCVCALCGYRCMCGFDGSVSVRLDPGKHGSVDRGKGILV